MDTKRPLIVIVGPTASGKTGLAIKIAKKYNGEIISADSRAIYKYMDIGTAKPTKKEQEGIKHWGINLVNPDERFTVADFQKYAKKVIQDIRKRGKLPIMVGGSGLYIDSVIFDYKFSTDYDSDLRQKLDTMTTEELIEYSKKHNIKLPENYLNKRYLIRNIERGGKTSDNRKKLIDNCFVVGITTDNGELRNRIEKRIDLMFASGIEEETRYLADRYSFDQESMKSNIYPIVWQMLNEEVNKKEAKRRAVFDDWHLAKKQITWFKRNPFIKWLDIKEAEKFIHDLLFE